MIIKNKKQCTKKLLLIGAGPHGKKAYLDFFQENQHLFNIPVILELAQEKESVASYLSERNLPIDLVLTEEFINNQIPQETVDHLNEIVQQYCIDGVIISSEASTHHAYADWALDNKLSVLIDKPIIADGDVVNSMKKALGIYEKFNSLYEKCIKLREGGMNIVFSVNTQRRFHPGYRMVRKIISEVYEQTGCPITSMISNHSDGQFRTPEELITIDYHGFNKGYGKLSHSGYHLVDLVSYFMEDTFSDQSSIIDKCQVESSFINVSGFLKALGEKSFKAAFGNENYKEQNPRDYSEYCDVVEGFGEIDAGISLRFLSKNDVLSKVYINLLHNSFTARDNVIANSDLSYGNGRIKHEWHQINQGPFQNIQIHSYKSDNDKKGIKINNTTHFDIHIYRSPCLSPKKIFEKITISDIAKCNDEYKIGGRLIKNKNNKQAAIMEFISALEGEIEATQMLSDISKHGLSNSIISSGYLSHNLRSQNHSPTVTINKQTQENWSINESLLVELQ